MRPRYAVALVPAIAVACSSFTSTDDAAQTDAGSDAPSGSETGPALDASDASDAAHTRETAPPICATAKGLQDASSPVFCTDFEDGNAVTFAFPEKSNDLTIVTDEVYSGTHALHAFGLPAKGAIGGRTIGKQLTKFQTLSFRARASSVDGGNAVALAARVTLDPPPAASVCTFTITLSSTNARLAVSSNGVTNSDLLVNGHPGPDRWFEVRLELTTGANYVATNVKINGVGGLTPEIIDTLCPATAMLQLPYIEVGANNVSGPAEIRFDDIVFDGY